jgi:hypothetical protein
VFSVTYARTRNNDTSPLSILILDSLDRDVEGVPVPDTFIRQRCQAQLFDCVVRVGN